MFVVACGGVIGRVRPMSLVSRLAFRDRGAIRVGVHVWTLRRSAVRIGGSPMFVESMNRPRRWVHVIVMAGTLRIMAMRVLISRHVTPRFSMPL
jgi:hypothetical protein